MPIPKNATIKRVQPLSSPVSCLKGIGPQRSLLFTKKSIRTVLDLLFYIPYRYEDRTRFTPLGLAEEGECVLIQGRVVSGGEQWFPRSRRRLFRILLRDGESAVELLWFQYRKPHLSAFTSPDVLLTAYGRIRVGPHGKQMIHPEIRRLQEGQGLGIYPVYSEIEGLPPSALRKIMEDGLERYLSSMVDPVPEGIRKEYGLPDLGTALQNLHLPDPSASLVELNEQRTPFHRRILFDRFFLILLLVAFLKKRRRMRTAPPWSISPAFREEVCPLLPFELTADQSAALEAVQNDLVSGRSMNRLILGDVGCGKTILALLASHLCVRNGFQAALMAPTQVLARQHYEDFERWAEPLGFRPVLVTGRMKKAERFALYHRIREGGCNVVIGTHALIQEGLSFWNLGLVVIDEQQRFGVRERALLDQKGVHAHQLVLTATPIPRTLAIAVYGDMDLSEIRQFPKGRVPVETLLAGEDRKREVFERLKRCLARGEQAFVICPSIEGDEGDDRKDAVRMAGRLKELLSPPYKIGLIHGRLPDEEKEAVMDRFRNGSLHLLVGTTVVEVGVHVPSATLMIIEHPERFGLSQLHQLRGRVGRGSAKALCYLMASRDLPEKAMQRLNVLVEHQDGFEIARKDMEQRGFGQLTGTMQAGLGELDLSEIMREPELLQKARRGAEELVDGDPELARPEHHHLRRFVDIMLTTPLDL
jgi:ATP-dependent DNA helicase RecG